MGNIFIFLTVHINISQLNTENKIVTYYRIGIFFEVN